MFKSFTPYTVTRGPMCSRPEFTPIDGGASLSIGFTPVAPDAACIAGIETVTIERKTVPADVLKRRVDALAADVEQQTGRKPGKKHRAELKEQALGTLLLNAFPKRKTVPLLWLEAEGVLLIGSTSAADTDAVTTLLVNNESGLTIAPVVLDKSPSLVMTTWLLGSEEHEPRKFDLGRSVTLDGGEGTASFKDESLYREVVYREARVKTVTSLALESERDVTFTLTDGLQVKGIKLGGVVPDNDHADAVTAECHLWAGELRSLWSDVVGEFA